MNFVTFSYSKIINLGRCSISSATDTTITSYWNSTEDGYQDFASKEVEVGDKIFFSTNRSAMLEDIILLGYIKDISATVVTISSNPGEIAYNEILRHGYITPFIKHSPYLYSYPISKYCGASLETNGSDYKTHPSAEPYGSAKTQVSENAVISLYFEKGDAVDEVKINIKPGTAMSVIQDLNKLFKSGNDVGISGSGANKIKNMISVKSITSSFVRGDY